MVLMASSLAELALSSPLMPCGSLSPPLPPDMGQFLLLLEELSPPPGVRWILTTSPCLCISSPFSSFTL